MTEAEVYRTPPTVRGTEEGCKGEWLGGEARVHYRRDAVTRPNSLGTDYGGFTGLAVALVFLAGIGIAAGALAGAGKMSLALAILLGGHCLPAGRFYLVLRGSASVPRA